MNNNRLLAGTFLVLGLSGCSSSPYVKDVLNNPERVEIENSDQSMRVSYLSKYLMESDDRARLEAEVSNSKLAKNWGAGEYSTLASMATDAHVGKLGSASGKALGNAVFVGGVVLGEMFDGQLDQVGQIFLPQELDGSSIDSSQQAESVVSQMLTKKINAFAETYDYQVSCLQACESLNQIFLLTSNKNSRPGYLYWPSEIAISTYVKGLEEAPENKVRDAMLGFNAKWQTGPGESFLLYTYSDLSREDDGQIKIRDRGYDFVGFGKDLNEAKVGREIRKKILDNPYILLGDADTYPSQVFYNGEVYSFIGTSQSDFVKYRLAEPNVKIE